MPFPIAPWDPREEDFITVHRQSNSVGVVRTRVSLWLEVKFASDVVGLITHAFRILDTVQDKRNSSE